MIIRAKLDWVPGDSVARAKPPAELAFRVLKTMEPVVIDGTSETILVEDRVVDVTIGAASTQRYILNVVPGMDIPNGITVDYVSDDPNIAECDGNIVNRVSNGTTTVTVTVTSGTLGSTSQKVGVTFTTSGGAIQYNDVTGVPDTPRAEATEVIRDYLIEGKSKNLFNGSAWNDNRWCAHIDLICVPMTPSRFYGALVTPRHILGCAHAQLGVGVAVSFKIGSSTVNRTIIGKLVHPAYSVPTTYTNDFCLYLLDDDVTGALPAKVLPDDWEALFPTGLEYIPLIGCDQEKKATVQWGLSMGSRSTTTRQPTWEPDSLFYEPKISGDSGSPCFLVLGQEPILLTVWTYGGPGTGSNIVPQKSTLNSMIGQLDTALGIDTGYTLTEYTQPE